jgi:hypothetical protein
MRARWGVPRAPPAPADRGHSSRPPEILGRRVGRASRTATGAGAGVPAPLAQGHWEAGPRRRPSASSRAAGIKRESGTSRPRAPGRRGDRHMAASRSRPGGEHDGSIAHAPVRRRGNRRSRGVVAIGCAQAGAVYNRFLPTLARWKGRGHRGFADVRAREPDSSFRRAECAWRAHTIPRYRCARNRMMAADITELAWSMMNTGSLRCSASAPMRRLPATHMAQARRLTPAEQCSRPRCTTCGT